MDIKQTSKKVITPNDEYHSFGIYVWQLENGQIVRDEDGNYLSIQAQKGDIRRMAELTAAANTLNLPMPGHPFFLPGYRKISDEEHEEQLDRLKSGLIPDEYDLPAYLEARNE
jgi:hypothetical protein